MENSWPDRRRLSRDVASKPRQPSPIRPRSRRRHPPAGPDVGAPLLPHAGGSAEAGEAGPLRPRHPSRRDRRALVRLHHRRRQRGRAPGRRALLRRPRGGQVHAQGRHRRPRRGDHRQVHVGHLQEVAGLLEVLRQPRADPPPHAPDAGAGRPAGPRGEARVLLLPPAVELDRQQLPVHLHGVRAGHQEGGRPQVPGAMERGGQRHPRPVQSVPPEAGHGMADPARRPPRARVARDV